MPNINQELLDKLSNYVQESTQHLSQMRDICDSLIERGAELSLEILEAELKDLEVREPDIEDAFRYSGNWIEQFASSFVKFLEDFDESRFSSWIGEVFRYPDFIGFRMGEGTVDYRDDQGYWIAVNLQHHRQVVVGVHFRDRRYFTQLKNEADQIQHEFGEELDWKSGQIYRIVVNLGEYDNSNPEEWFENLYEKIETFDRVFRDRLYNIHQRF